MASCPIRAEMFQLIQQQEGQASALPNRRALPPTPSAKGVATGHWSVFLT